MNWSDEEDAFEAAVPLSQRAMAARPMSAAGGMGDYLADLNPAQREAVLTSDGPVLMLAGAGTGKTKALMARIAHLIATGSAQAHQILAHAEVFRAAEKVVHGSSRSRLRASSSTVAWKGAALSLASFIARLMHSAAAMP